MIDPQLIVAGGTASTIALLLFIVQKLWSAHEKEDERREARLLATEQREDRLTVAVADSTRLLTEIRDEARELRNADQRAYAGQDRRRTRQS